MFVSRSRVELGLSLGVVRLVSQFLGRVPRHDLSLVRFQPEGFGVWDE